MSLRFDAEACIHDAMGFSVNEFARVLLLGRPPSAVTSSVGRPKRTKAFGARNDHKVRFIARIGTVGKQFWIELPGLGAGASRSTFLSVVGAKLGDWLYVVADDVRQQALSGLPSGVIVPTIARRDLLDWARRCAQIGTEKAAGVHAGEPGGWVASRTRGINQQIEEALRSGKTVSNRAARIGVPRSTAYKIRKRALSR